MSKVNPDHYKLPNGFQVIDLTSQLDFCSGNVVKYVARAGNKEGESVLDDLLKAAYYLNRLIDKEKSNESTTEKPQEAKTRLCPPSSHSVRDCVFRTVAGGTEDLSRS